MMNKDRYKLSAGHLSYIRSAIRAGAMQQVFMDIARECANGRLSLTAAVMKLEKERIRIDTMYLMLSFPLEERMN